MTLHKTLNGTFKQRGRNYLPLLACPIDHATLVLEDNGVCCTADPTHHYPFEDGILRLIPADQRAAVAARSAAYEAYGAAQGWDVPDEGAFKSLPQTSLPGYPDGYWEEQATHTALLWRFLEAIRKQQGRLPIAPVGDAAIIGAGMGWLAYALDVAGYATLALDSRAGLHYGLGTYPIARYPRIQIDLTRLPLASEAFDWLIFQEGLTPLVWGESQDQSEAVPRAVFHAALDALRPGGWLAVIKHDLSSSSTGTEVYTLFEEAALVLMSVPQRNGWYTRLFELRDRLKGQAKTVSPVLVAQKPQQA